MSSSESVLAPRYRVLALGLVTLVAAAAFSRLGVSTALPAAADELGGLALYGWVFTAFTLANVVGLAVAGPIFDRYGIVRPLAVGTLSFAGGLLVSTVAPSMGVVVLGRVLQGLGAGALSVAAYSAIGKGFPDEVRPKMLALNASAFTVPSLVGPVLAGLVAENLTWRWVFAVLAPLAPVAVLLVRGPLGRVDREPADSGRAALTVTARSDAPTPLGRLGGGLALSAGLGAALVAPNLPAWPAVVALVMGVPFAYLGVRRVLPPGTLGVRRGLPTNVVFAAALSTAFFTADLFIPLALTSLRGTSAPLAGTVLTAGIIGWTVGAYAPARLVKSGMSKGAVARLGASLVIAGLVVIAAVALSHVPVAIAAGGWVVAGLGAGAGFTTNSLAVLDDADGAVGSASSQMELGNQVGVAVGTGLASGWVAASGTSTAGLAGVFLVAGVGALLALLVTTRFARDEQPRHSSIQTQY
ncbi:MFS transporter [Streptomyces sp. NP160]|uniref:MFS transporter n=1 Tax=Streptomyces sp. NP160 TaxID=2586637 RepID=UPI0015D57491|nr:MFS transporter [Streptomyces sp. NP160]